MRALSLHGAWAHAILHCGKIVENRTWAPNPRHYGTRIAIHAAANPGSVAAQSWVRAHAGLDVTQVWPKQCILGTVTLLGTVRYEHGKPSYEGFLTRKQARAAMASVWFAGPIGWVLSDPMPAPTPIACRGKLQLWEVSRAHVDILTHMR